MDAVAERAGVSKATIYRWWPTKETLALDMLYNEWTKVTPQQYESGSLRVDLLALLHAWSGLASGRPYGRVVAALLMEGQTDPAFSAEYQRRMVEPRRDQARAIFGHAIERGEIPADTKVEVAIDLLYGPLYHRLLHGHAPLDDQFVDDVVDMALRGLQPLAILSSRPDGPSAARCSVRMPRVRGFLGVEVAGVGELVRVESADGIATIRLDRPKMNALNAQVQDEIGDAAAQVSADPAIRAVILYGGERVFAAGADIKEMAPMSFAEMDERSAGLQASFSAVAGIPKPVVAAVTGYALGGGLELALCADFRVLGESAKVGQPEILLGIIPGAGGTQRLPRLIGPAKAKDLDLLRQARGRGRGAGDRPGRQGGAGRRGLPGRQGHGRPVRGRPGAGAAGRQAGRRPGPRGRSGHRPGDRAGALRRPVRHRGPEERHAQLHRERPGKGRLRGPLTVTRATAQGTPAGAGRTVPYSRCD